MAIAAKRKQFLYIGGTIFAAIALLVYLGTQEYAPETAAPAAEASAPVNPLALTQSEQITLGLKAAPALVAQYDGISTNQQQKDLIMRVGSAIAGNEAVAKAGWKFHFQLLAEPDILNAFALPGGQIFVTTGLLNRLTTEGEVAALLAQQIAHVMNRDAITKLAADMASSGLASSGANMQEVMVSQLVGLTFTTAQEAAADQMAIKLVYETGYNPNALLGLMKILATAYYAGAQVEYFTTHPNAADRVKAIQQGIATAYPEGVPDTMSK